MTKDKQYHHPHYSGLYFSDYEFTAKETASYKDPMYLPLGLGEEVGELLHEYARCERKGVEMDKEALISECGDVLWIISQICRENGFSMEQAARNNMEKLTGRAHSGSLHDKLRR